MKKLILILVAIFVVTNYSDNIREFFIPTGSPITISGCGDNLCSSEETKTSCPSDCDEFSCLSIYRDLEEECIDKGWNKLVVDVDGIEREILWKGPKVWTNGAIIAMHGGEGTYTMTCSAIPKEHNLFLNDILQGVPSVEFAELAVSQGFAVFSLNSTRNRVVDKNDLPVGKRWDTFTKPNEENIDLDFIEKVISKTIPGLRSSGSEDSIFMTGISNGGFMTTLASTHFSDQIQAIAPIASGNPYGMYYDMTTEIKLDRPCAPGTIRDIDTSLKINEPDSCLSESYTDKIPTITADKSIPFKQFYREGDAAVDKSCVDEANILLNNFGFEDSGMFIIENSGRAKLEHHFWQTEYNQPILNFFKEGHE